MKLKPRRGGFLRPFGCGWFIREYLFGNGPQGSPAINATRGATQSDINHEYRQALARATALDRAERIISRMVAAGKEVTEEDADQIYQRELKALASKFRSMRYHSFLMYFGNLKQLGWVELTGETEPSTLQDYLPDAPPRIYYRLSAEGEAVSAEAWSNPLFVRYPQIGPSHSAKAAP